MRTILATALVEELIPSNPCAIRGAGQTKRTRRIEPATLEGLAALVGAMPERLRLMPLLASWCGLRFGELVELRRRDIDMARGSLSVTRGMVRVNRADVVGKPKSAAGVRDVAIPPHLHPVEPAHMAEHVRPGRDALMFPHSADDPTRHFTHG